LFNELTPKEDRLALVVDLAKSLDEVSAIVVEEVCQHFVSQILSSEFLGVHLLDLVSWRLLFSVGAYNGLTLLCGLGLLGLMFRLLCLVICFHFVLFACN
jgi:hypothetical protein